MAAASAPEDLSWPGAFVNWQSCVCQMQNVNSSRRLATAFSWKIPALLRKRMSMQIAVMRTNRQEDIVLTMYMIPIMHKMRNSCVPRNSAAAINL